MKEKFIITVTNSIEGCTIEKYLDPICSNIVIGTNLFSDFAASLSDIFGGFSETYKNKLETIYNKATASLRDKAKGLGANAIVGFSVDFDEISGGGKSMFMISASGTACVVKHSKTESEVGKIGVGVLSQSALDFELRRRFIVKSINEETELLAEIKPQWKEFLYEYPQMEIVEKLISKYVEFQEIASYHEKELSFITKYFLLLPKEEVADVVYSRIENTPIVKKLIKDCCLFSPSHVLTIAKRNPKLSIQLLDAKTDYYQGEDLALMKEILNIYDTLPETGRIEMVKGGLLSKDEEKFICENGHKNKKDVEFCSCGINIKGLTAAEVGQIEDFREKLIVLEELL